jgi:hypothetical protein
LNTLVWLILSFRMVMGFHPFQLDTTFVLLTHMSLLGLFSNLCLVSADSTDWIHGDTYVDSGIEFGEFCHAESRE